MKILIYVSLFMLPFLIQRSISLNQVCAIELSTTEIPILSSLPEEELPTLTQLPDNKVAQENIQRSSGDYFLYNSPSFLKNPELVFDSNQVRQEYRRKKVADVVIGLIKSDRLDISDLNKQIDMSSFNNFLNENKKDIDPMVPIISCVFIDVIHKRGALEDNRDWLDYLESMGQIMDVLNVDLGTKCKSPFEDQTWEALDTILLQALGKTESNILFKSLKSRSQDIIVGDEDRSLGNFHTEASVLIPGTEVSVILDFKTECTRAQKLKILSVEWNTQLLSLVRSSEQRSFKDIKLNQSLDSGQCISNNFYSGSISRNSKPDFTKIIKSGTK